MKEYLIKRFGVDVDMISVTMNSEFFREGDVVKDSSGNLSLIRVRFDDKVVMSKLNWFGKMLHNSRL